MLRAFLALPLPDTIRAALRGQQVMLPLPSTVAPASLHLTLVFLGEQPEPRLAELDQALSALRLPSFDMELRGLDLFGIASPRHVCAMARPVEALIRLQAKIERLARASGCKLQRRRFHPHVTLGACKGLAPEARIRLEQQVAQSRFAPGPFAVHEFALYRSTLGKAGSHYDMLASYPLERDAPKR
jgi:2'-5' RNA ligase